MSLPEILHRSAVTLRQARERHVRSRARLTESETCFADPSGSTPFLFDPALAAAPLSPEAQRRLQVIVEGRATLLGIGEIPRPLNTHAEPSVGKEWPRVFGFDLLKRIPAGWDPRLTWELNRGHDWVVLARGYAATRDAHLLARLTADVNQWLDENPVNVGINWSSAMEAAIRIHSFAWTLALLQRTDAPQAFRRRVGGAIAEHARFVRRNLSRYSSANNHLIVELSGLVVAGRVLRGPDALALRRQAIRQLEAEASRQVLPDGVNAEMAVHYHVFVMEAITLTAILEARCGEPNVTLDTTSVRMADYVNALAIDDCTLLSHGDSDDGSIFAMYAGESWSDMLRVIAMRQTDMSTDAGCLLNGDCDAELVRSGSSRYFPAGGQIVLRGDRLVASLDAGPFGFGSLAAHAHCDSLAIHVAIGDQRILVDRGTYRYNGDAEAREWFRSTQAHNTLQVAALQQADAWGTFLWGRRPSTIINMVSLAPTDLVEASHDGFAPHRHWRRVVRRGNTLVLVDRVTGGPPVDVTVRFHMAPGLTIQAQTPERWRVADTRGHTLAVFATVPLPGATARVTDTPHSDHYAQRTFASTLELHVPQLDARTPIVTGLALPEEVVTLVATMDEAVSSRGRQ